LNNIFTFREIAFALSITTLPFFASTVLAQSTTSQKPAPNSVAANSKKNILVKEMPALKLGLWDITTSSIALPASKLYPSTGGKSAVCVTQKNNTVTARVIPQYFEDGMTCQTQNVKINGNEIAWKMLCETSGSPKATSMIGAGIIAIEPDRYSGKMTYNKLVGGKNLKVTQTIVGKWRVADACK
jgi:hypothetical protein